MALMKWIKNEVKFTQYALVAYMHKMLHAYREALMAAMRFVRLYINFRTSFSLHAANDCFLIKQKWTGNYDMSSYSLFMMMDLFVWCFSRWLNLKKWNESEHTHNAHVRNIDFKSNELKLKWIINYFHPTNDEPITCTVYIVHIIFLIHGSFKIQITACAFFRADFICRLYFCKLKWIKTQTTVHSKRARFTQRFFWGGEQLFTLQSIARQHVMVPNWDSWHSFSQSNTDGVGLYWDLWARYSRALFIDKFPY